MSKFLRRWRRGAALVITVLIGLTALPVSALAGTTGTISGTVTDATTGKPIADASVAAAAPSGSRTTTTDARGFYVLQSLLPDTYTVSVQATGYDSQSVPGVVVQQDLTTYQNLHLAKALKTIAAVHSRSAGNLVQPGTTSDVYNVSGAHLNAIAGGNDLHKTLYQYIAAIPGVTGSGFPAQPRIHGGSAADIAYDFDGIPINERISGRFTTNLSNVGMGNVEVFTGGLDASQAASGLGIINTVVKTGSYPGALRVSYGTSWQYSNQFETLEYGNATPNHRYSWYLSVDNTNSLNQWADGHSYPAYVIQENNGPGVVKTTDIIGNFHYRPNSKDDFQFLIQNGLGEFIWSDYMRRAPGEPVPLSELPCPGAVANSKTYTGGSGGTAPNGQPCPLGLYFSTANTQSGGGNIWHHYSGIGKIQWNHLLNDHSFMVFKLAENFNQYIFDQPIVDMNLAAYENDPYYLKKGCPQYPYTAGSPVPMGSSSECSMARYVSTGYYEDRSSNMYIGSLDYINALNENLTLKAGVGYEWDQNREDVLYTNWFNPDGTWPAINFESNFPTSIPDAYVSADVRAGKWLFSPGLRYTAENYFTPMKFFHASALTPTFAFNYHAGLNDVIRGSATESTSLVASEYVYRNEPKGALNGPGGIPYCGPTTNSDCNFVPSPTRIRSFDLMWEHEFADGTSLKFGPDYWRETNIFQNYTPYNCDFTTNPPTCTQAGPQIPWTGGVRQSFGVEFGLNHVDSKPKGISYWLSATYDNFWASSLSSLTTPWGNVSLPPAIVAEGHMLRSSSNPFLSGTLTLDAHKDNVHFMPMLYYQGPVIYYSGSYDSKHAQITAKPNYSLPYSWLNATVLVDLPHDLTIGIQGQNVLNNTRPITPCTATVNASLPNLGMGCSPFWPVGAGMVQGGVNAPYGITAPGQYASTAQSTPLFMLFISKKI